MLQSDYRLGGKVRYFALIEEGSLMLVPPEVRKCVVFIGYKASDGRLKLGGTAFFISIPMQELDLYFVHLITAKHIIDEAQSNSIDQKVYLRANFKDGGARTVGVPIDEWVFHPTDASVDVAVIRMPLPIDDTDFLSISIDMAVTDEIIREEGIGVGDEVFLAGQFTRHRGRERNLPIIRIGHIAMMPEEPVLTKMGLMDAYLMEVRSIGGHSGSPVFIDVGGFRIGAKKAQFRRREFYWLGLVHGHWDLDVLGTDVLAEDVTTGESINMGIAVVVPVSRIMEVLNQKTLVEERKAIEEREQAKRMPTPDSTQEGLTKEAFEDALRKVSRPKESPPAEEMSET